MTLREASAKIDIRLNKGASGDYDNLWSSIKQEAVNKAVIEVIGRLKRGKTDTGIGDEETSDREDDLQILLKFDNITVRKKDLYYQTSLLPSDYLYHKRTTPLVSKDACSGVRIKSHLREEANVDDLLDIPSFEFEETFHTLMGNREYIYHNNQFTIDKVILTYYRKPVVYDFKKPDTQIEFKQDLCEIIIDEACKIIASDIESINQKLLAQERAESNK